MPIWDNWKEYHRQLAVQRQLDKREGLPGQYNPGYQGAVPLGLTRGLDIGGNPAMSQAFNTLMSILEKPGQLDPRESLFRRSDIAQTGASKRQSLRQGAAQAGLQNAGLIDAIDASVQAGTQRGMTREALDFAARQEEQELQDITSILDFIINPSLSLEEIEATERNIRAQGAAARKASKTQELLGSVGTAVAIASLFCWVAREIYGSEDGRWRGVRNYILHYAPDDVRRLYAKEGQALAEELKRNPELKKELKPVFDEFLVEVERHQQAKRGQ